MSRFWWAWAPALSAGSVDAERYRPVSDSGSSKAVGFGLQPVRPTKPCPSRLAQHTASSPPSGHFGVQGSTIMLERGCAPTGQIVDSSLSTPLFSWG